MRVTRKLALVIAGSSLLLIATARAQTNAAATTAFPAHTNSPAELVAPRNLSKGASDVVKLFRVGKKDNVLLFYVSNCGLRYHLSADDIVYLKAVGVSSEVITAMLESDKEHEKEIIVQHEPEQLTYTPAASAAPAASQAPVATSDPVYQQPATQDQPIYVPSPVYPDYSAYPSYYQTFDNPDHPNGHVSVVIGIGVGAEFGFGSFYHGNFHGHH